jgi:hypothetical protein
MTIALLLIGLGAGLWWEREPVLQGLTDLWIISDPVTHGDAVVVLGGGLEYRPFIAADLYKTGLVTKILVSRTRNPTHTELNQRALLRLGVPEPSIEVFGMANSTTEKEARALRGWAEQNVASVSLSQVRSSQPVACIGFFTASFAAQVSVSRYHPSRKTSLVQGGGRRALD